jgi:hypothetical protein
VRSLWWVVHGQEPGVASAEGSQSDGGDRPALFDDLERLVEPTSRGDPESPTANALVERLIGTLRRECLDHVIILNEQHLVAVLREFVAYYNRERPHRTLGLHTRNQCCARRQVRSGRIRCSTGCTTCTRGPPELRCRFCRPTTRPGSQRAGVSPSPATEK